MAEEEPTHDELSVEELKKQWRKSKSLSIALKAASTDNEDSSPATEQVGAKDLISKFNKIIDEHSKAARSLGKERKRSSVDLRKMQELAKMIAERKQQNQSRRSSLVENEEETKSKKPEMLEVKLKHVEAAEKPAKQKSTGKLPQVKLTHIVDNTGNIEYEDFLHEEASFEISDIKSELGPSSLQYFHSISTRETLEFMEKHGDNWQERLQQLLEEADDEFHATAGDDDEEEEKVHTMKSSEEIA